FAPTFGHESRMAFVGANLFAKALFSTPNLLRLYWPFREQVRSYKTMQSHDSCHQKQKRPDHLGAFSVAVQPYAAIDVLSLFIALFSS
ncbi:hypothetical protein JTE78_20885, partial [Pseudomonas syringae pv. aptata]